MSFYPLLMAWPASGRRACISASIAGFAKNAALYGHKPDILVSIDAPLAGLMATSLPATLSDLRRHYGFTCRLFDLSDRLELFSLLKGLCPPDLLEYAFYLSPDGPGWGCNVNVAMLLGAGRMLVSTDDDIECRPALPLGQSLGGTVVPCGGEAPSSFLYYPSREALLAAVTPVKADVVGSYAALLRHRHDNGGHILTASPGLYGDTAMKSSRTILLLEGESRDFLHAKGYETLRMSRELLRIPAASSVGPTLMFMATQFAADNSLPLPPFMTFGRNIDGAFMLALRIIYPGSMAAHTGFGLYHNPPEPRIATEADLYTSPIFLSDILMGFFIDNIPPKELESPEERFEYIGSRLIEAAGLSASDFAEYAHQCASIRFTQQYEKALAIEEAYSGNAHPLWKADIAALIANIEETLREPSSLFGAKGCGLSIALAQKHIGLYGRLLTHWCRMHECCRQRYMQ